MKNKLALSLLAAAVTGTAFAGTLPTEKESFSSTTSQTGEVTVVATTTTSTTDENGVVTTTTKSTASTYASAADAESNEDPTNTIVAEIIAEATPQPGGVWSTVITTSTITNGGTPVIVENPPANIPPIEVPPTPGPIAPVTGGPVISTT